MCTKSIVVEEEIMKKWVFISVFLLLLTVCLEPPRDNLYDPLNPDKVNLGGTTYRHDGSRLPEVSIRLIQRDSLVEEAVSGSDGWFEFSDIDPGIYKLVAKPTEYYYMPVEFLSESLSAGTDTILDIHFSHMVFDFESEPVGTREIPEWTVQTGWWQVVEDTSHGPLHSVPNVFRGYVPDTIIGVALCLTNQPLNNFFYEVMMKSDDVSPLGWQMGMVFRYQNEHNFYRVRITETSPNRLVINKVVDDNVTVLYMDDPPIARNVWYKMTVECVGTEITFKLQGHNVDIVQIMNDPSLDHGKLGMLIINPGAVHFDDISVSVK